MNAEINLKHNKVSVHEVRLTQLIFHPGGKAGMADKTAWVTLKLQGPITWASLPTEQLNQAASLLPTLNEDPNCTTANAREFVSKTLDAQDLTAAHWLSGLVVWLQRLAFDPVHQARVIDCDEQNLTLALPWVREKVLRDSLLLAIKWLFTHIYGNSQREVLIWQQTLSKWLESSQKEGLPPNTQRFITAAWARGIPVTLMHSFVQLGWGAAAQRLDSSFTGKTSSLATRIARNKIQTKYLLAQARLPVPWGGVAAKESAALLLAEKLGWPVAVKPSNQDQGNGVTAGIYGNDLLLESFQKANRYSNGTVIIEKHIPGDDHRLLVVGGQLLAATRRTPGGVWGDGVKTVSDLLAQLNADPRRGKSKRSMLLNIDLDAEAKGCLLSQGLSPDSVPPLGCFVPLRRSANISMGGTADDLTAVIHPDNRALALRATRVLGLDIAGVDFLCPDLTKSWREVGGAICEVNAQPGFRVHWLAQPDRDINGEVLDWLFKDTSARIPTTAISGTNDKSFVAKMLQHVWLTAGKNAGVCTNSGTWIGQELMDHKNVSGLPGAQLLLNDSTVEAAVLELSMQSLNKFGHPCDQYDVTALLNAHDDHIDAADALPLAQLAPLKADVLTRAKLAVVLDALDPLCRAVLAQASAKRHILVGRDVMASTLREHLSKGGDGVFVMNKEDAAWIVLASGSSREWLMPLADIPSTVMDPLQFTERNALFTTALAWAHGISPTIICCALRTFESSHTTN